VNAVAWYAEMPLSSSPEPEGFRQRVRDFLRDERDAYPAIFHSGYDRDFSRRLGSASLLAVSIPREYGGAGLTPVHQFIAAEELLAARAPIGSHIAAERQTAPMLLRVGSEEQKSHFLPLIAAGLIGFALGMSEPDSGSDLSSVRTRATAVPGGWSVTGTKVWTSWADRVQYAVALCRTSPQGQDRHAGLSQFIIDLAAPGVTISPIQTLDGRAHFSEVSFEDVYVPENMLLGKEGSGWKQVTSELAYERSGPDRWLSTFGVFSSLIAAAPALEDEAVLEIGRAAATYRVLHEMSYGIARAVEDGEDPASAGAVVKDLGTTFEQALVVAAGRLERRAEGEPDDARVNALSEATQAAALIAPGFTIRGGTTQVLRTVVSRELLR
jgi:alkylation response protein AidB-like acyl-CoA dehydrogenase